MPQHKGGKKQRKHGRNKLVCAAYRNSNTREYNKAKRLKKHLARHAHDAAALKALAVLGGRAGSAG